VAKVWAATNERDHKLTEHSQPGIESKTYAPGCDPPIPNSGRAMSLTGIAMKRRGNSAVNAASSWQLNSESYGSVGPCTMIAVQPPAFPATNHVLMVDCRPVMA